MKPIEIHIEGYKIVISEDDKEDITYKPEKDDDTITLPNYPHAAPYPYVPHTIQPQDEWWKSPTIYYGSDVIIRTDTTLIDKNETGTK